MGFLKGGSEVGTRRNEGLTVGRALRRSVGGRVGLAVGRRRVDGILVGTRVGILVGTFVGVLVGLAVGA